MATDKNRVVAFLSDEEFDEIENFRKQERSIPSRSRAVADLIRAGLAAMRVRSEDSAPAA